MRWKLKSKIQNTLSLLPSSVSYGVYYQIQRNFGGLKQIDPISKLQAGIETWKRIVAKDYNPVDKTFLEIGTGRIPLVPLSYWLMGATQTITVDLNPYLKGELVKESLEYIATNQDKIKNLFGSLLNSSRFEQLLTFSQADFTVREFLDLCQIEYLAPSNAADTQLPPQSIDFHTSYTVFEHISPEVLKQILLEGNRIIKDDGLFIHKIDYGDHFAHSDPHICAINFLQYSDEEWDKYAGNRYMYMNRLRHDDFLDLYKSVGHQIVDAELDISPRSQKLLESQAIELDRRFSSKSKEILSIAASWMISKNP